MIFPLLADFPSYKPPFIKDFPPIKTQYLDPPSLTQAFVGHLEPLARGRKAESPQVGERMDGWPKIRTWYYVGTMDVYDMI
jgi:hypothetical protein